MLPVKAIANNDLPTAAKFGDSFSFLANSNRLEINKFYLLSDQRTIIKIINKHPFISQENEKGGYGAQIVSPQGDEEINISHILGEGTEIQDLPDHMDTVYIRNVVSDPFS